MKKLLTTTALLLLSGTAFAQAGGGGKGCRVLIGEDWVAMGATSIASCFKYAEAAATPGERQFAEFGSTELAYQDGQYFQSTDGGANWQRYSTQQGGGVISSLNVLRVDPAAASPEQKGKDKSKKVDAAAASADTTAELSANAPPPPARQQPAKLLPRKAPAAAPPTAASSGSEPSSMLAADTAAAIRQGEPAGTVAPAPVIAAAPGKGPSRAQQEYAGASDSSAPRGCQMHVADKWKVTPTSSLADCGRLLAGATSKSGAKSGQAYWAGNYLFFSGNQLYRSADGQEWRAVK